MTTRVGMARRHVVVRGIVQGVGFRPYVARLATELGLCGRCHNDATCVEIDVEGDLHSVDTFVTRLPVEAPPLARVESVHVEDGPALGFDSFTITESQAGSGARTMVPPDAAICADCARELFDPADRRYRHPFISCTNCGPRFTITVDLPYDRAQTTMAGFPMCPRCAAEYTDPLDRRYHAQPIACHDCGPRLWLRSPAGASVDPDPLATARAMLAAGSILAVKGLGGYHLVCNASDAGAVQRLRERKRRPHQPFAVMTADLAGAARIAEIPDDAATVLTGTEHPILLLPRRGDAPLAPGIAPGLDELGILLPYTPLHLLLVDGFDALVMTSANLSGEPICYTDEAALTRLAGIVDAVLGHDREIAVPCEDSVIAWSREHGPVPVRRSRGYAPLPLPGNGPGTVFAAGAEIKNTFALTRDGSVFCSAHLGDLGSLEGQQAYQVATDQALRFHRVVPDLVVSDQHPSYSSRVWALRFADQLGVPVHEVQHHHAHLASLASEHGVLDEPVLGVVLDGTGYGCDATIWGGELLLLQDRGASAERLGHLGAVPLPGGDAGVRNPVRTAAALMLHYGIELAGTPVADELSHQERAVLESMALRPGGWALTSSAGRLFDAVSALLGVRHRISYEAQAAIELEVLATRADRSVELPMPVARRGALLVVDPAPLVAALADAARAGEDRAVLARSFHLALARGWCDAVDRCSDGPGPTPPVGLTGGVFGNRLLTGLLAQLLTAAGHRVLMHRQVPANDGGLALGQAAVGLAVLGSRE